MIKGRILEYKTLSEVEKEFTWDQRWELFDGNRERFNIAHECVDRHPKNDTAIRIKFAEGRRKEIYNFGDFSKWCSQFANFISDLGIEKGDKVAILLFPSIEFYVSMFGTFKRGAVVVPCFPLFGPEAISFRLEKSEAKAIITTSDRKELVESLGFKDLKVILADDLMDKLGSYPDTFDWDTNVNDLAMIQFSSGTTGAPKSVRYRHGAITVAAPVVVFGIGLREDDNYFCPSSPAWGHGIWYGTIAPLIFGKAIGSYSGKFDPEICLEALEEFGITNISAISSHYRLMAECEGAKKYKLKIRMMTYTGEPMTPELIKKVTEVFGVVPHCLYGTTEVGPLTLDYAYPDYKVKPGSLGKPLVGGAKVAVVDDEGNVLPPGKIGQIAIFRDGKWERIGDAVYMDEDGYFWYVSRADDVIISAGYTIGPIEVEEALKKHPSVDECAVVGSPDKERGEIVKAFIKLKPGWEPSDELAEELKNFVKDRLSKHEYPREIEFIDEIPKTPDGKVKRKELKKLELKRKGLV